MLFLKYKKKKLIKNYILTKENQNKRQLWKSIIVCLGNEFIFYILKNHKTTLMRLVKIWNAENYSKK